MSKHLWFSTGIAAQDRLVAAHKARLECLIEAINAMGRLRSEWGFDIDSLPPDVNAARESLRASYFAELRRRPSPMPRADDGAHDADYAAERADLRRHLIESARDMVAECGR